MRYDRIRRVLVVVIAGLIFLPAALFSQVQLSELTKTNSGQLTTKKEGVTSHARMVRLSYVIGAVSIKRPGSAEEEKAILNAPIEEGYELYASGSSFAEVQFENGSTARLSALSKLLFYQLALDANGDKLNGMTLEGGIAGFHFIPERQDSYAVKIADATLTSNGKTEVHAAFVPGKMQVDVLSGSVTVSAHSSSLTLGKGKRLEYHPLADGEVAKSHARVVRLSYVSGTVMVKRPGSTEEEKAMVNTPIQEGFELSTSDGSYAEVEFENGSTARIGELSRLLFHQLALDANGSKLNGMTFEQGYGTFHFLPEHSSPSSAKKQGEDGVVYFQPTSSDVYHVKVADATVTPDGKCEFRTDLERDRFRVEVFNGSVAVATPTLSSKLVEGNILEHKTAGTELAFNFQKGIVKDAWDQWTGARDKQVLLTAKDEAVHPFGANYGWSDLNTYGEWVQFSGRRFGWSPYARAGWSPYTHGQWQWYPGFGWTWVSGDPWGWVTDHCGAWDFDASFGWYWMSPMWGCGMWEPSLVNWYSGPGWIGWAPSHPSPFPPGTGRPGHPHPGPGSRPGHPPRGIVTVPTTVVQNRQIITLQIVNQGQPTGGSMIDHPPFGPSPRPTRGAALPTLGVVTPTKSTTSTATAPPASLPDGGRGAGFGSHHGSAPSTILMGGDAAKESALLGNHGSHFGNAPLRAVGGTTLGGRYAVSGSPGEFRGDAFGGGARHGGGSGMSGPTVGGPMVPHSSSGGSGPVIVVHGSSGGGSHAGGSWGGGGGASVGGVGVYSGSIRGQSGGGGGASPVGGVGHTGGGGGGASPSGGGGATPSGGGGGHH